jgi:polyketide biosynthesis enoyl-CoA hydratase PksI
MGGVVNLSYAGPHVAVVELADREHSNLFSRELVEGLVAGFAEVRENREVRAVVVHGYDSIFCAGGTREELLRLQEGRVRFDDVPLYRIFLDCEVPVVAAMQGHALGGGLVVGLYADALVLAEESLYSSNFMKYGFTPGMGATLVMPLKLGHALASEMMLTARNYYGGELRRRGVAFPVVARRDVIPTALQTAREIAEKPRASLALLKQRLNAQLVAALPEAVERELEMHAVSFALPEVRARIETLFGV